ncbi:MAG: phosphotransferase family protein [Actinobacteria bacterium]|nr:phosphotransferase family protein [Actinomycetota bacterium]
MSAPEGIFESSVTSWLDTSVDGAVGPYSWEIIAGGHSNLTFLVTDANGRRLVLRRPPLAHGLASAHDMAREHRIISALNRSSVPVPTTVGLCEDDRINGAPFYVMEYVDGHVVRDVEAAERLLSEPARARASESLAETLAAIHEVDLVSVGLNDLGRHEDYLARQLRRWYGQWEQQRTRDLSLIDDVHAVLIANLPAQQAATIVHGDYRLDNTMVDEDGNVCAVLDWEICTLGDPLADIAMLAVYWTGPTDTQSAWESGATTAAGFWDRNQLIERYAQSSGRDLGNFDLYMAFANWKLACILEGVYARYLGGALGERDTSELEPFKRQVDSAARAAADLLNVN